MKKKNENERSVNDPFFLGRKALYIGIPLVVVSILGLILNIAKNNSQAIFSHSETRPAMVVINNLIIIGLIIGLLIITITRVKVEGEMALVQRVKSFFIAVVYVSLNSLGQPIFNSLIAASAWQSSNTDQVISFLAIYNVIFYIQRWRAERSFKRDELTETSEV